MSFNLDKFNGASFSARTADVAVHDLADFFEGDDSPKWQVRGLSGHELGQVNEAVEINNNLTAMLGALASENIKEKIDGLKESLGLTDKTPNDLVRRIALLKFGSVEPKVDQPMAVRMADAYPVTFYALTNKILELTGQGKTLGK